MNKITQNYPNPPEITQEIYNKTPLNKINGLYRVGEDFLTIKVINQIIIHCYSYVFFKNGLPNNEEGPAIVDGWQCYFYVEGSPIKNKPFSFHNFHYKDYPVEIFLEDYPEWNGYQFEVDLSKIYSYKFYNDTGMVNNFEGPATYSKLKLDNRTEQYMQGQRFIWSPCFYLHGEKIEKHIFYSPEGEDLRRTAEHKKKVLKIIQTA